MNEIKTSGVFIGLEDAPEKETPCVFVEKGEEIEAVLDLGYAASCGCTNGSVTVYKDCDGFYRGLVEVHYIELERIACDYLVDISKWFDEKYKEVQ